MSLLFALASAQASPLTTGARMGVQCRRCAGPSGPARHAGASLNHGSGIATANRMSTVLVVDDEMLIRWAITESLTAAGFGVVEACSAGEALERFAGAAGTIAVALLDLRLSDPSDFGLLRQLKVMDPACQVILMTADDRPGILDEAVRAGAFHALAKPFDLRVIAGLVRQAAAA